MRPHRIELCGRIELNFNGGLIFLHDFFGQTLILFLAYFNVGYLVCLTKYPINIYLY